MKTIESNIQIACVRAFRLMYPKYAPDLIAVPNGGNRSAITGAIMKREGVARGIPDLLLLVPKNGYGAMWIEMKAEKGKLTPEQKAFFERNSYRYRCVVCRSVDEFLREIKDYLNQ